MNRRIAVVLGLSAILAVGLFAQGKANWEYLGEANIDGKNDHDRISVGRDDGQFRAIQIQVDKGPVEFNRVVVHYGNGSDDTIPLRETVRAGSRTRAINLEGNRRAVRSVEFWYEKARIGSAQPRVALYGMR